MTVPSEMPVTLIKRSTDQKLIIPEKGTAFQVLDEKKNPLAFHVYYPHSEELTVLQTDESERSPFRKNCHMEPTISRKYRLRKVICGAKILALQ
ncbi:MAG: hypothetical protein ACLR6B_08845 [Blautia sp.]